MIRATIDTRSLERKLQELRIQVGKTAEDNLRETAQIGAKQLAIRTEPYGLGTAQKDGLQKGIYRDVNKAYDYIGQTFNTLKRFNKRLAYAFSNAVKANDLAAAERYARQVIDGFEMKTTDSGQHLQDVRSSIDGHVRPNSPVVGISNNAEIDKIASQQLVTAGTAKAGWMQAGKEIGMKARIPVWLRKSARLGYAKFDKNVLRMSITLYNNVRYVSNVITEGKMKAAVDNALKNQMRKLNYQLKNVARRF